MKKILLLCSAGMSTSIVVKKMKEAATEKGILVEIEAEGLEKFQENIQRYDVFLLGPQVRFKRDDFNNETEKVGRRVEVINQLDYGMMNGKKILDWALSLF